MLSEHSGEEGRLDKVETTGIIINDNKHFRSGVFKIDFTNASLFSTIPADILTVLKAII